MLDKKIVRNILLEVEESCRNYAKYLQEVVDIVLNDNSNDIKYLITKENDKLTLYKYSESDFLNWLCCEFDAIDTDINDLFHNYGLKLEYTQVQKKYIDYYIEENILNFINVRKFRKKLYNDKFLLQQIINDLYVNIRNYQDNEYLIYEYNLNKKLYHELKKIQ